MATHGPINGVRINRACSGSSAHILARPHSRFSFRPLARIGCSYLFLATLSPNPQSIIPRLQPHSALCRTTSLLILIIAQPSTIPERSSKSLPLTERRGRPATSRTPTARSSEMARLVSSFKRNLSPNMRAGMTLRSRRSYRTSGSRSVAISCRVAFQGLTLRIRCAEP